MLGERLQALFGAAHARPAFERERLGHDADGERARFTRELRDHGGRTGAGAAAHAGRDEHHVGSRHDVLQAVDVLERSLATLVGVGAGAESARHVGADRDLFDR